MHIGEGLKVARNVHCDSDYWHARCVQFGNGCLDGPLQLQAVSSPPSALAVPAEHADPDCKQRSNRDHDHQKLSNHELLDFWIHGGVPLTCSSGLVGAFHWNDGHADRSYGNEGEFDVLNPEGDSNDGDEAGECGGEMAYR